MGVSLPKSNLIFLKKCLDKWVHFIGNEIAKPMRRFDKTLDYVPTQYICDYIKHLGYDGIKYKSTLSNGGTNYAIFKEKKFECVQVKVVHIGNIQYEWAAI